MDSALQPSALPAALLNTQVKKIKETRCLVIQRTGFCTLFRSFTRKRTHSSWILRLEWKKRKNKKEKNFCLNTKTKKCFKHVSITLRRAILCLIVSDGSPTKKNKGLSVKKQKGLEMFAFSVSVFQREKVSPDLSHMHYRYTGRSGVKGRGFNNITFLRFAVLLAQRAQRAQRAEMPSDMWSSLGKHRCPWVYRSKQLLEDEIALKSLIWPIRNLTHRFSLTCRYVTMDRYAS